jgi:hypothetical protein
VAPAAGEAPGPSAGGGAWAGLGVHVETPAVTASPGQRAELRIRLTSNSRDEVRGEAQLISPFGTWDLARPWTRGFSVPAGGQTVIEYEIRPPTGTGPLSSWVLVKVMAFGWSSYTESIPLAVTAGQGRAG